MRYTYAISALRDKRARLAGEIAATERALAEKRAALTNLDATLRLFHPTADPEHITSIRPVTRGIWFRLGERPRLCLEALRDAGRPLPAPEITTYVMRSKGWDVMDRMLRRQSTMFVHTALGRLEKQGTVRRIIEAPDVWWELVELYNR